MRDADSELRQLLREVARKAPPPKPLEPDALRRVRRRRVGAVVGTALVAIGVGTGLFVGLRFAFLPAPGDRPAAPSGLQAEAIALNGVAIRPPDGWTLIELGGERKLEGPGPQRAWPVLQLSNFDPGLANSPLCSPQEVSIPPDGVLLYLQRDLDVPEGSLPGYAPWPVSLNTAQEEDGPCGPGLYTRWTAGPRNFQAYLAVGEGGDPDIRLVEEAFSGMDFTGARAHDVTRERAEDARRALEACDPAEQPSLCREFAQRAHLLEAPKLLLRVGRFGGKPRAVLVLPAEDAPPFLFPAYLVQRFGGTTAFNQLLPEQHHVTVCGREFPGEMLLVGPVAKEAARVEARLDDGRVLAGEILRVPEGIEASTDIFVARVPAEQGVLVALDGPGGVLERRPIEVHPACSEEAVFVEGGPTAGSPEALGSLRGT